MGVLTDRVNNFTYDMLKNYEPKKVRRPKVIHDSVLGTNQFYAHEIAVIDSPMIQRLRRISQVDVVSLVWPSGNHNRFEHSIGVTVIADRMVTALFKNEELNEKLEILTKDKTKNLTPYEFVLYHVRMAGILHDCGHGPFSHISEAIYCRLDDMKDEMRSDEKLKVTQPNAHEALSYLIVTSKAFKEFFNREIVAKYGIDLDLDLIGAMIIGYISDPELAFMVDIINGPFDADKLDYIQRDSHFTGIKMILDLDRLFYTLSLIEIENDTGKTNNTRLTIDISGVTTLEEIVFDKMMLFTTVYNHQKVRSAEGLFKSVFEGISEQNDEQFTSAVDFLKITDDNILGLARHDDYNNKESTELAKCLLDRELPKKALVISNRTVEEMSQKNIWKIRKLNRDPAGVLRIRKKIAEYSQKTNKDITYKDIWFDVPKLPKYSEEGNQWPIKSDGAPKGFLTLHQIFPVDQWCTAFSQNKWKAHVFTKPEFRKIVNEASRAVITEEFEIELTEYADIYSNIY